MCNIIRTENGAAEWQTQGDLAGLVGGPGALRFDPDYSPEYDTECCLCPVDIPATLDAAGIPYREERGWAEWVVPDDAQPAPTNQHPSEPRSER